MGIKNIHIALIVVSLAITFIFGIWGLKNDYQLLGCISMVVAIGLIFYGVDFLKKVKSL